MPRYKVEYVHKETHVVSEMEVEAIDHHHAFQAVWAKSSGASILSTEEIES